jgi:hypothetical protein
VKTSNLNVEFSTFSNFGRWTKFRTTTILTDIGLGLTVWTQFIYIKAVEDHSTIQHSTIIIAFDYVMLTHPTVDQCCHSATCALRGACMSAEH